MAANEIADRKTFGNLSHCTALPVLEPAENDLDPAAPKQRLPRYRELHSNLDATGVSR
jgi:hypothetical protein